MVDFAAYSFPDSCFPLGKLIATPAALAALVESGQSPIPFLDRHVRGDWGDCDAHDSAANDLALKEGERIFSVYHTAKGVKIWLITEADRSSTCLLLPADY